MLTYGLAVLSVLIIVLGGLSTAENSEGPVKDIRLIRGANSNVSFDEGLLQLTISGNTTVYSNQTMLEVNSTTYRDGTLKIDLGGLQSNPSKSFELHQVNYTVKVNMSKEMPDEVLVHGVFGETARFESGD